MPEDDARLSDLLEACYPALMPAGYDQATLDLVLPLMTRANPALLMLAEAPLLTLAALVKVAAGLFLLSYAVIGPTPKLWLRLPALVGGLSLVFAFGI